MGKVPDTLSSPTSTEQHAILSDHLSQTILSQARDCSSSLIGLDDSASVFTETTAGISATVEFDSAVLGSSIYQAAYRSHLRQVLAAQRQRTRRWASSRRASSYYTNSVFSADGSASTDLESNRGTKSLRDLPSQLRTRPPSSVPDIQISDLPKVDQEVHPLINSNSNLDDVSSSKPFYRPLLQFVRRRQSEAPPLGDWSAKTASARLARNSTNSTSTLPARRKVFILGQAGSGKTTLLNAFIALEGTRDFVHHGLEDYVDIIWHTVVSGLENILPVAVEQQISFDRQWLYEPRSLATAQAFTWLWTQAKSLNAYSLPDNFAYYIAHIERLANPSYVPTAEDILRSYRPSGLGTHTESFEFDDVQYDIIDTESFKNSLHHFSWIRAVQEATDIVLTIDPTTHPEGKERDRISTPEEQIGLLGRIIRLGWINFPNIVVVFTKLDLLPKPLRKPQRLHGF